MGIFTSGEFKGFIESSGYWKQKAIVRKIECLIFADQRNLGNDKSNNGRHDEQSAEEDFDKGR